MKFKFTRARKKTLLLIIIVATVTMILNTVISIWLSEYKNIYIPSIGTIRTLGVEVYGGDIIQKDGEQYFDWGKVFPSTIINRSCYIRSISNINIILKLETTNWTFRNYNGEIVPSPTESYYNLEWDYNYKPIESSEEYYVNFTLCFSSNFSFINYLIDNKVTDFSFEIFISPTKYISSKN